MKRKRNANSNAQINRNLKYRRCGCPFMNIYALFKLNATAPNRIPMIRNAPHSCRAAKSAINFLSNTYKKENH